MKTAILVAMLLILPMAVVAQDEPLQVMLEQQQQLREELDEGIEGLTPRQVRIIRKAQNEFFSVVAGKQTLDDFSIQDKVRVENALETVNAQIVNTAVSLSDQNVCWREQTTGSKTKTTRCGTQREIDEAREGARGFLERPKICVPPGCGT